MSDKTGRPSIYTEELAQRICNELAEGNSLHMICATDWAPHISTVMAWRLDDTKRIGAKAFQNTTPARARRKVMFMLIRLARWVMPWLMDRYRLMLPA